MYKRLVVILIALAVCLPALAKPKKKIYDNSATDVFDAALRTARERHVVTYVNEKMLMLTFATGHSFLSERFCCQCLGGSHGGQQMYPDH
jgi:hypothetical protein